MQPQVESFFDAQTGTFSHVLHAGPGTPCAVIDPVLGYTPETGAIDTARADDIVTFVRQQHLTVEWILETHVHADHLSAAAYMRDQVGGTVATSATVSRVQHTFIERYALPADYCTGPGQFDHLFAAEEHFNIGKLKAQACHVPGHTPADTAYVIEGGVVFVGDTLFLPDVGTARCDFPGGSAVQLYRSIRRLLSLPGDTQLFMCHDYPPDGREPCPSCTVAEQLLNNERVRPDVSEKEFVAWRMQRDATLGAPRLLKPSLLVNLRAGVLPGAEAAGVRFMV